MPVREKEKEKKRENDLITTYITVLQGLKKGSKFNIHFLLLLLLF